MEKCSGEGGGIPTTSFLLKLAEEERDGEGAGEGVGEGEGEGVEEEGGGV